MEEKDKIQRAKTGNEENEVNRGSRRALNPHVNGSREGRTSVMGREEREGELCSSEEAAKEL